MVVRVEEAEIEIDVELCAIQAAATLAVARH